MKILTLVSEYPSYEDEVSNIFVHKLVKGLQQEGQDICILLMDFRSIRKKRKYGLSSYEYDGIKVYRCAVPCGPIPFLIELLMKFTINYAYKYVVDNEGKPDVIHVHFGFLGYLAKSIENNTIPYIITEHSSYLLSRNGPKYKKRILKKGYIGASGIVAVSSSLKQAIVNDYDEKVKCVIPNILGEDFNFVKKDKENKFTIIAVGRLVRGKRFELLISAVSNIRHKIKDIQLWIVGNGEMKSQLIKQVEELKLQNNVCFWGNRTPNELQQLLNRAHVFALPSDVETFGVVYIEANGCGIPVIATDCGGPSDFVDENNGIIIPKNDQYALEEAILKLKREYERYDHQRIADNTQKKYGKSAIVSKYLEVYEEIINDHQRVL